MYLSYITTDHWELECWLGTHPHLAYSSKTYFSAPKSGDDNSAGLNFE